MNILCFCLFVLCVCVFRRARGVVGFGECHIVFESIEM